MTRQDIVTWLRREHVETGSLICLGCGHEHACGTKGCAVLRAAADLIDRQHESMVNMVRTLVRHQKTIGRLTAEVERLTWERDAAIKDIVVKDCRTCCHSIDITGDFCPYAKECYKHSHWAWRGLCVPNGGTEGGGNSVQSY